MKILFVGGTWNLEKGKKSSLVEKFSNNLPNVTLYNGGNYNDLENIIKKVKDYDIVLWWPNVDNSLPKIRNVKEVNYKTMLVSSKNNIEKRYSFQELLQRALSSKSNLMVEFTKKDNLYNMKLFDPLGNLWYEGTNIGECSKELVNRLKFIKNITRESTVSSEENNGALAYFFNMFKQEMYKSDENPAIPIKKEFLKIVREYAAIFAQETFHTKDIKRFLGNTSFRCPKGFPSFRDDKYIFVSRRNINKEYITIDEFVPTYLENDKVYYCGDFKPSVDTPIQVRLYQKLKNINYMIHSHCYIEGAPYTKEALPCGAIEEVEEILNLIDEYYNSYEKEKYLINLKGHGSIMMSNTPKQLQKVKIKGRIVPEKI